MKFYFSRINKIIYHPDYQQWVIPGFSYYANYVNIEEQNHLIKMIDQNQWITDIKRRQQHYGYQYYETTHYLKNSQPSQQILINDLSHFDFLIQRMINDKIFNYENAPTQVLVNEYKYRDWISMHIDNKNPFGDVVVGLSLLKDCYMNFQNDSRETKILLQQNSIYVLKDEARYNWKHGIKNIIQKNHPNVDKNYRRISLSFRKINPNGCRTIDNIGLTNLQLKSDSRVLY